MPPNAPAFPIDLRELAVTHLAHFVGVFANQHVMSEMKRAGFGDLRQSHGFLVQHLLREPHSVGELARLMGVTQQAVSKTVAELTRSGYLETEAGADARVRVLRLSDRGHAAVLASRRIRDKLERRLADKLGPKKLTALRAALADALHELDGTTAVKGRRVPVSAADAKG